MKTTPKDFFLHLGLIASLYVSTVSLLALLFQIINYAFPDRLDFYVDPYSSGVRWSIAALIIIFPLHVLFSYLINKDYASMPEKRGLGIRKWLMYITIFLAGAAIAVDLIVLINTVLGGEIATRFILKVLAVFLACGLIFGYYVYDLRSVSAVPQKKRILVAVIAGIIVVASIVGGFMVMGSPMTQRLLRFDAQKVIDLQSIQGHLVGYWQQKGTLPQNLAELNDPISAFIVPNDPQDGSQYEYKKTAPTTFELCATFNKESTSAERSMVKPMATYGDPENWVHGEGRSCFTRPIDAELYPVFRN